MASGCRHECAADSVRLNPPSSSIDAPRPHPQNHGEGAPLTRSGHPYETHVLHRRRYRHRARLSRLRRRRRQPEDGRDRPQRRRQDAQRPRPGQHHLPGPAARLVHRDQRQVQGADRRRGEVRDVRLGQRRADEDPDVGAVRSGPRHLLLGTTFTPTAYATGAFLELKDDDWKKLGGKDAFLPATLGISGPDAEHQVGIPFTSRPFVMAYNTDLLKAAGIDKPADSWDGLLEQAKKLTSGGTYGLAVAYADGFDPWKFIWAMSVQAGNPLVKDKKASLNDPTTLKAYQTYLGWLATDKVVNPAAVGWKNAQAIADFGAGKAAFLPMVSATSKVTLDKSAVAGKYAYAIMPTIPPGQTSKPGNGVGATSILSGDNLVVAKYTKNKDLALALVKLLTSPEQQESYYKTFGELPTNATAAKKLQSDPALAPIIDSASKASGTPFNGAWSQVQLALVNVVVQSIPALKDGKLDETKLKALIADGQKAAQDALDKSK
ncbi:extracellular solute-binding protein [Dactylosporangium cerinum]